jgi:NTP pyrophosphatase (non-canonical NTP hydrolase)
LSKAVDFMAEAYRSDDTTIRQAQNRVKAFLDSRPEDWSQIDNHFYVFTHMTEEIGEMARHVINIELRLSPDRTAVVSKQEKNLQEVRDDLGDIFYTLLKMAIGYNIDLEEAFAQAMSSIEKRYSTKTN